MENGSYKIQSDGKFKNKSSPQNTINGSRKSAPEGRFLIGFTTLFWSSEIRPPNIKNWPSKSLVLSELLVPDGPCNPMPSNAIQGQHGRLATYFVWSLEARKLSNCWCFLGSHFWFMFTQSATVGCCIKMHQDFWFIIYIYIYVYIYMYIYMHMPAAMRRHVFRIVYHIIARAQTHTHTCIYIWWSI